MSRARCCAEFGATFAIVGHSERRTLFGDSDAIVAEKYAAARKAGLTPIFCVGESLEERERGVTEAVLARQLDAVLEKSGAAALDGALVAYEPVWAIGTGRTATAAQAQEAHAFLRGRVAGKDAAVAARLPMLYGGSVKGSERGGTVRDARCRWRTDRRGVAGGGRIRGDLARSRRRRLKGSRCIPW